MTIVLGSVVLALVVVAGLAAGYLASKWID